MIDISKLLERFDSSRDMETSHAFFKTNRWWMDQRAFLNIIYKPAPLALVAEIGGMLKFPPSLYDLYYSINGARLFVYGMAIYGCVPERQQLDRANPHKLPPFSIQKANREFQSEADRENVICIGSYGFDRSLVCICRDSERVFCCVGEDFALRRKTWPNIDLWLEDEIVRISVLFNERGEQLVPEEQFLPKTEILI